MILTSEKQSWSLLQNPTFGEVLQQPAKPNRGLALARCGHRRGLRARRSQVKEWLRDEMTERLVHVHESGIDGPT